VAGAPLSSTISGFDIGVVARGVEPPEDANERDSNNSGMFGRKCDFDRDLSRDPSILTIPHPGNELT